MVQENASQMGIKCEKQDRLGLISLEHTNPLNPINSQMHAEISKALLEWENDPGIYTVLVESSSQKSFSVGADLKELLDLIENDPQAARQLFYEEIKNIWLINNYTRPYISLVDGYIMGSGVGLAQYGTHSVAGEGYKWSMPEAALGFFPDIGITHKFSSMPSQIGLYLALTGRSINRWDAIYLGLSEHAINREAFEDIKSLLRQAEPLDPIIDDMRLSPEPSELEDYTEIIETVFSAPTLGEIFQRLEQVDPAYREWADALHSDLSQLSPLSLSVTFEKFHRAKGKSFREILIQDYQLMLSFLDEPDFKYGLEVMTKRIEPSGQWPSSSIDKVSDEHVRSMFEKHANQTCELMDFVVGVD